MRVPLPEQLSSVPAIDNGAMGWAALLTDGLGKIRVSELAIGVATATWPGGQTFSTALQVVHGLSKPARVIFTQPTSVPGASNGPPTSAWVAGATPQQFQIQWFTIDGVNPAGGSICNFCWVAMF